MKVIFLTVLNILIIRFQLSFYPNIMLLEVPLLISLYFFLNEKTKPSHGLFFSCFLGLISDFLYGYPLGLYGFSLTLTGYITYFLYNKLYIQSKIFLFLIFFLSHIINSSIFYFLIKIFNVSILRDYFISFFFSSVFDSLILSFIIKKR